MRPSPITTLIVLILVTLLSTAGIALPFPLLAPFFMEGDNALTHFLGWHPKVLLGLVLAIYPLGVLIGSGFLGALSDHFNRKHVMLGSLLAAAAGYVLTGVAVALESYPLLVIARLITGICEGNIAIARAMVSDLHPDISRTRAFSLLFAGVYAGWLSGPLAGGYLMFLGVDTVFYIAAGAVLVCAFTVLVGIDGAGQSLPAAPFRWRQVGSQHSLTLLTQADIRPYFYFQLLFCLGTNALYEFYPLWLVDDFAFRSDQIAWMTVVLTLSMIATSTLAVPPLARRIGHNSVLLIASGAFAATVIILPFTGLPAVYPLFILLGALIALFNGVFSALMAEKFEHYGQGKVMGLITSGFFLAGTLMAAAGGGIAVLGSHWALVAGGICTAAAGLRFVFLTRAPHYRPLPARY